MVDLVGKMVFPDWNPWENILWVLILLPYPEVLIVFVEVLWVFVSLSLQIFCFWSGCGFVRLFTLLFAFWFVFLLIFWEGWGYNLKNHHSLPNHRIPLLESLTCSSISKYWFILAIHFRSYFYEEALNMILKNWCFHY